MEENLSTKRIRKESGKRWTKIDKSKLLSLISENPTKFEKPTAQIFYCNLIKQNPEFEEYGWKGMRDKMRNLKASFTKAVDWIKNTGSGLTEEDGESSVRAYVLKICEDFEALEQIFSKRTNIMPLHLYDSADLPSSPSTPTTLQTAEDPIEAHQPETSGCSYVLINNPEDLEFVVESPPTTQSQKRQRLQTNNSTALLAQAQKEKTDYLKEKLEFLKSAEERKLRLEEEQLALQKIKLDLERQRMIEEIRLKEMEVQNNFELGKMRLERELALNEKKYDK